ncbi:MAG: type II toxin-antitoxin system mRNA interferase toxin, RelE/StbE family [Candidatus Vogelbacteria bacterium]|nr:type II toxin-antitoxin system mRNA interferase toxin, RelE/StbE family [Candidatus Vogelbacteria bacterium]
MKIQLHKHFIKQYKKLRTIQRRIDERLSLFRIRPFDPALRNHGLAGKYQGCRSINITGDFRAIYELVDEETVRFIDLDTHSNLYK